MASEERKSRKPHGATYKNRRRCPFCGMIVNDSRRFTWDHLFQTFEVIYGGRASVTWNDISGSDHEYAEIMRAQFEKLASRLGYKVTRIGQ